MLSDIKSDFIGEKQERKKIELEAEDNKKKKYENNQRRKDEERSEGIQTCTFLLVWYWMLLCYHMSKKKYRGDQIKLNLWNLLVIFLETIGRVL